MGVDTIEEGDRPDLVTLLALLISDTHQLYCFVTYLVLDSMASLVFDSHCGFWTMGKAIVTVVPFPTLLSMSIFPLCL